jgi:multidrug efflux pump subunit AcrA (membrane-fusion protein)
MPRCYRLIPVCLLLTLCGCAKPPIDHKAALPRVDTIIAATGAIRPSELLAGVIAPLFSVAIQSALTEPSTKIAVKEGQYVQKGQLLAQLDTADLQAALNADLATAASARATTTHTIYQGALSIDQGVDAVDNANAALQQAQAKLREDRIDLARYVTLASRGYIARQQVDLQETTVRTDEESALSAQATLAAARSNMRSNGTLAGNGLQNSAIKQAQASEQTALAQAEKERVSIVKATIESPIDGIVVNRNFNPGEYPGTRQLFTIQKIDRVYAILHGSASQIARIQDHAQASILVSDVQLKAFRGTVVAVLSQIVPGSTDFEVKVLLPNRDRRLKPGMTLEGRISLPEVRGVRIPETAFTDDTRAAVLVLDAKNIAHTASVSQAGNDGKYAIVTGIARGARVIVNGQSGIVDGEQVVVQ